MKTQRLSRSALVNKVLWMALGSAGLVLSLEARRVQAQSLPDDVDYSKYYQNYLRDKQTSDARRGEAHQLLSNARALDQEVAKTESDIRDSQSRLAADQNALNGLAAETPALRNEAARLQAEATGGRMQIDANVRRMRELDVTAGQIRGANEQEERRNQGLRNASAESQRRLDEIENSLQHNRQAAQNKSGRLAEVKKQLPVAEQNRQALQNQVASLNAELVTKVAEAKPLRERAKAADTAFDAKKDEVEALRTALQAQRKVTAQKAADLEAAVKAVADAQAQVSTVEAELAQIDADLAALRAQPTPPADQIAALEARRTAAQGRRRELNRAVGAANQAQGRAQSELQAEQAKQQNLDAQLDAARAPLEALKKARDDARAAAQAVETRIGDLRQVIPEVQKKAEASEAEANALRAESGTLQNEIANLRGEIDRLAQQREGAQRQRDRANQDVAQSDDILRRIGADLDNVLRERNGLDRSSREISDQVRGKETAAAQLQQRAQWNDGEMSRLSTEIADLQRYLAAAAPALRDQRARQAAAYAEFRSADAAAARAEGVTATSLAKYQEVRKAYDVRLRAAKQQGSSQGVAQGGAAGEAQGTADGTRVGRQEGEVAGTEQGRAAGLKQGRLDGAAKGQPDGYAKGRNAPEPYNEGYALGTARGQADANNEAQANDYPNARRLRREQRLAILPDRFVELDNAGRPSAAPAEASMMSSFLDGGLRMLGRRAQPLSVASLTPVMGVEARAIGTTLAMVNVDPNQANCALGATDFINACREAYTASYQARFDEIYRSVYDSTRATNFESARGTAFEAHKNDRYQEGYAAAYAAAFAQGESAGAADARSEGFSRGKADGYANRIADARANARARGVADEDAFFQDNPVVRMLDAQITTVKGGVADGLVAGDEARLALTLGNFGLRGTNAGQVKIQLSSLTQNVAVEEGSISVTGLPGNARALVRGVAKLRISRTAGAGTVRIKIKAILPDGTSQEREASIKIGLHIFAAIDSNLNLKPWINQGLFAPKKHVIEVTVKNPTDNDAKEDFRVELQMPDKDGIEVIKGEADAGTLDAGESRKVELQYRLLNKDLARGNKIPIKIRVFYGKRLSAEQALTLEPVVGL